MVAFFNSAALCVSFNSSMERKAVSESEEKKKQKTKNKKQTQVFLAPLLHNPRD